MDVFCMTIFVIFKMVFQIIAKTSRDILLFNIEYKKIIQGILE